MKPPQVYKRQRCRATRTDLQSIRTSGGCEAMAVPGSSFCQIHRDLAMARTMAGIKARAARRGA